MTSTQPHLFQHAGKTPGVWVFLTPGVKEARLASFVLNVFLLLVLTTGPLFPLTTHAATPSEPVRLLVQLKNREQLIPSELSQFRAVRRLSTRAPRSYQADGTKRLASDMRSWRVVEVAADEVIETFEALKSNPAVANVHYEETYQAAVLPNDPHLPFQYGLVNVNPLASIHADAAWEKTTGSSNTIIAIIDGGVDINHEDLRDKLWVNDDVPGNHVDDDNNGFIDDTYGWDFVSDAPPGVSIDHGTHVAGIAAATSNNGIGVTGVNWQARIMSLRVLNASGVGGEENILNGIAYAVANGADVINLSLVGSFSPALTAAVENAYAAGVVVVAAMGNSGVNTDRIKFYPACADVGGVDMVLGVGATDEEGEPASFSNYGACVNVSAPGKKIVSTKKGNDYGEMTGTSMSSPLVAGVAGLYLAVHPNASPAEVIAAVSQGDAFTGPKAAEWNEEYKSKLNAATVVGVSSSSGSTPTVTPTPTPTPSSSSAPTPTPTPIPQPAPAVSSNSGGGGPSTSSGSSEGGGGGGGGGGGSEEPQPTPKPKAGQVKGVKSGPSATDRKAPDFIKNNTVPAVVARIFKAAFGRVITPKESTYWKARARSDKATEMKLRGALLWHKLKGKTMGR